MDPAKMSPFVHTVYVFENACYELGVWLQNLADPTSMTVAEYRQMRQDMLERLAENERLLEENRMRLAELDSI